MKRKHSFFYVILSMLALCCNISFANTGIATNQKIPWVVSSSRVTWTHQFVITSATSGEVVIANGNQGNTVTGNVQFPNRGYLRSSNCGVGVAIFNNSSCIFPITKNMPVGTYTVTVSGGNFTASGFVQLSY